MNYNVVIMRLALREAWLPPVTLLPFTALIPRATSHHVAITHVDARELGTDSSHALSHVWCRDRYQINMPALSRGDMADVIGIWYCETIALFDIILSTFLINPVIYGSKRVTCYFYPLSMRTAMRFWVNVYNGRLYITRKEKLICVSW